MKDLWSDLQHLNGGFMSQHNPRVESDNFDPHIIPAETAARKEREQENYKHPPKKSDQDIDSTGGYTVDQEGLVNNFAIEQKCMLTSLAICVMSSKPIMSGVSKNCMMPIKLMKKAN
jgi:hypothetical protein